MSLAAPAPLNPAQQEVLDLLGARRDERPQFDAELRHQLRAELEHSLADLLDDLDPDDPLWVSKHALAMVHACEARHVAERDQPFSWSGPTVRGVVAHKAIG